MADHPILSAAAGLLRLLDEEIRDIETAQRDGAQEPDAARLLRERDALDRMLRTSLNYFLTRRGEEANGG